MSLSLSDVREKKQWVADRLKETLQRDFNLAAINVAHGIAPAPGGGYDFAIRLTDLANPDTPVAQDILDYAAAKISEWVPGSHPDVRAVPVQRRQ